MTVAKVQYTGYATYIGTLVEVLTALSADKVPARTIIAFYYDAGATATTAVVGK